MALVAEARERKFLARGKRMPFRQHHPNPRRPSEFVDHIGIIGWPAQEADIRSAGVQRLLLLLRRHLVNAERNLWESSAEDGKERAERAEEDRARRADVKRADLSLPDRTRLLRSAVGLGEDGVRLLEKSSSRRRKLHPPAGPHKESGFELPLEIADLLAERGLRNPEPVRRGGEAQFFGDGHEITQVPQLHRRAPVPSRLYFMHMDPS